MTRRAALAALAFASIAGPAARPTAARAEPPPEASPDVERQPAMAEDVEVSGGGVGAREMATDTMISPRGWQLGSSLSYATSRGGVGDHGLAFTDVVFLRLAARTSVRGKAELYGGVDLLPKQPSFTDDLVYQGAHVGALIGVPGHKVAVDLRVDQGAMMEHTGWYGSAKAGVVARSIVHDILAYQGEVAGAFVPLRFDQGGTAWLAELQTEGNIVFRAPEGMAAAWVGVGFAFPLAHKGEMATAGRTLQMSGPLDPQVRSDFRIGGVVSLIKQWDVYAEYAVIDRGDYAAPRTMLPILDGGFDQQQLTIGIVRHFGHDVEVPDAMRMAAADGGDRHRAVAP